jgi:hypothetical protein
MAWRALCVGINAYEDSPLQGCVNDADDWAGTLAKRGAHTLTLLDHEATKARILDELRRVVAASRFGDRVIFTYSGHGTWVPDRNGDEADRRDEALCAIDYADGGLILDDELEEIYNARRRGVRVITISDSCHSGTVSRVGGITGTRSPLRPRFISPFTFLDGEELRLAESALHNKASLAPRSLTRTILLAGCSDLEYSYDAWINGRFNGAFTRAAIGTLPEHRTTYAAWHRSILATLDFSVYPQSPQLYCAPWQAYTPF